MKKAESAEVESVSKAALNKTHNISQHLHISHSMRGNKCLFLERPLDRQANAL